MDCPPPPLRPSVPAQRRRFALSLPAMPPWPLLALAALGVTHILVRTASHGAAIGADSVTYLSTVENLLAGHGLQDFRGHSPPQWPWLFPLLVAAVAASADVEAAAAARLINAAAFGAIILLAGTWFRRAIPSRPLAAGATLVVATSHHLSHSASYVMTEATFIAFTLFAIMRMDAMRTGRMGHTALAVAALGAGLAAATRYAGVAVILTGALLLLWAREYTLGDRLRRAAAYVALAAAPLGAMLTHNRLVHGVLERPRLAPATGESVLDALQDIAGVMAQAAVPGSAPDWLAPMLWLAAGVLACCVVALRTRPTWAWLKGWAGDGAMLPAVTFTWVYLGFILATVPRFSAATIGEAPRYLLPLQVPLLLMATLALHRLMRLPTAGRRTVAKWTAATIVGFSVLASVIATAGAGAMRTVVALRSGYFGKSYNTAYWRGAETIRYLREHPVDTQVLANRFGLLHAALALGRGAKERGKYRSLPPDADTLARRLAAAPDGALVVWLHDGDNGYGYDDRHLRSLPNLSVVAELADGLVFRVTRPPHAQAGATAGPSP